MNSIDKEELYYTPELEEFHIGFECEYLDPLRNLSSWKERIIENKFHIPSQQHLLSLFRVKKLNKEDIESFGFKQGSLKYQYFTNRYSLIDLLNNKYSITDNRYESVIFYGIIKNKSELRRILKQTEVI
jgi:hypothetical protein